MVGEQGDVVNLDFVFVSIYGYHRPECTLIRLDPFHLLSRQSTWGLRKKTRIIHVNPYQFVCINLSSQ